VTVGWDLVGLSVIVFVGSGVNVRVDSCVAVYRNVPVGRTGLSALTVDVCPAAVHATNRKKMTQTVNNINLLEFISSSFYDYVNIFSPTAT
jgi:hypothetical protein